MNISLINPPWILEKKYKDFFRVTQPDGLGYIASVLREKGHKVQLIDAASTGWRQRKEIDGKIYLGMDYSEILRKIKRFSPDVIGVSIISSLLKNNGYSLCNHLKEKTGKLIVVGGAHPTVAPQDCLNQKGIDICVMGEGEETMIELLSEIKKNKPNFKKISGISYKRNKRIQTNSKRDLIKNLDNLPLPARDLYPMEEYYQASRKLRSSFALSTYNKRWATIISSRGCPHNCIFCSIHLSMGRQWRARSAEHVFNEISLLVNKYQVQHIAFLDDNMTLNNQRINKICDLILENNIKFQWSTPNGLRADSLNEKLLLKMKKSGCERIAVAPESGSQQVVSKIISKNLKLSSVSKAVKLCHKIGLKVDCFFVFGLPGETKHNLRQTLEYAKKLKKLGADGFNLAIATPFIGTRLYKIYKENGDLPKNFDEFTMFRDQSMIATKHLEVEDLINFKKEASKLNGLPVAHLKYILLVLLRDPMRFFELFTNQLSIIFSPITNKTK